MKEAAIRGGGTLQPASFIMTCDVDNTIDKSMSAVADVAVRMLTIEMAA